VAQNTIWYRGIVELVKAQVQLDQRGVALQGLRHSLDRSALARLLSILALADADLSARHRKSSQGTVAGKPSSYLDPPVSHQRVAIELERRERAGGQQPFTHDGGRESSQAVARQVN
jgi:hypothetical protein